MVTVASRVADAQNETQRVIISSGGEPSGFSIDLWSATALCAGVPLENVKVEIVRNPLDAIQLLRNGQTQAAAQ